MLALVLSTAAPISAAIGVPAPAATEAGTPTEADVAAALAEHKATLAAMTAKERRAFKKEQKRSVKQVLKQYKKDLKSGAAASTNTILLVILALFIPPLAVFLHQGEINGKFWLNLILTLLLFLPGLIHALIVILGGAKKK